STDQTGFYPMISVTFHLIDSSRHYHVPVLLSPFAYSTYQGS
ncbi:MAG: hydroxyisourate hydrolase, partial [Nakamurella sp.]